MGAGPRIAAELAGDPAVVSRAEALRPIVEKTSSEIEDGRRLPPADSVAAAS